MPPSSEIIDYAVGHGSLQDAPGVNHEVLKAKGFTAAQLGAIEEQLATAFDIKFVFNKWSLGPEFCTDVLGFTEEQLDDLSFDMLRELGFLPRPDRRGEYLLLWRHDP